MKRDKITPNLCVRTKEPSVVYEWNPIDFSQIEASIADVLRMTRTDFVFRPKSDSCMVGERGTGNGQNNH